MQSLLSFFLRSAMKIKDKTLMRSSKEIWRPNSPRGYNSFRAHSDSSQNDLRVLRVPNEVYSYYKDLHFGERQRGFNSSILNSWSIFANAKRSDANESRRNRRPSSAVNAWYAANVAVSSKVVVIVVVVLMVRTTDETVSFQAKPAATPMKGAAAGVLTAKSPSPRVTKTAPAVSRLAAASLIGITEHPSLSLSNLEYLGGPDRNARSPSLGFNATGFDCLANKNTRERPSRYGERESVVARYASV
ncbi:uncharacterized protein EV422DRAFT_531639 [Fimicolochytrium jonesii]|uniref:uncharacterized protein n=1 Tax=Fimicolochytrium jonesii TaxID=1396493 RepID=UPI0022FEBE7C|nr:uncharacterized protein EV422DRAFT_531639 [Fimicolochytrium jonesii]KAI8820108.1 hypothetical protein EV422DRAFT_531639 [Fimicolochytrium jonesii]